MKIIDTWLYHERVIFLTRIDNHYQLFYRSSGLAGHNSKGLVFPILRLKDNDTSPDGFGKYDAFGWLPKLFVYRGKFQKYRSKIRSEFPENMHAYLDELEKYDKMPKEENDPSVINKVCNKYIKNKNDYKDWYIKGKI